MTGPEHYRQAERTLFLADDLARPQSREAETVFNAARSALLAEAQVHATLALAAATAYPAVRDYIGDESGPSTREWASVA